MTLFLFLIYVLTVTHLVYHELLLNGSVLFPGVLVKHYPLSTLQKGPR